MASVFCCLAAVLLVNLLCAKQLDAVNKDDLDPNGYVLYCPCMGRFGNQADHFLGALSFAHGLNRTLVLPPWVEYIPGQATSVQIAFDKYFKVEPLLEYHRVMTMEKFMKELAPEIWPPGKRAVFCYQPRHGSSDNTCNAKDGNPFGPFWDHFKIDFDESVFYGPLHYDTHYEYIRTKWLEAYPSDQHYVMAFTGAPASFPVMERDIELHQYLQWSDYIDSEAEAYLTYEGIERPYVGLHLRNGVDWENACRHATDEKRNLFGSAQCLGFRLEHGSMSPELCLPSEKTIVNQVKKLVKKTKAKSVVIATDDKPMTKEIQKAVGKKVKVVARVAKEPHIDLALLGKADFVIANCVSTFSSVAVRERRANNKPVEFWAFKSSHDEL